VIAPSVPPSCREKRQGVEWEMEGRNYHLVQVPLEGESHCQVLAGSSPELLACLITL